MSVTDFDEADALERTAGDRTILADVIRFTLEDVPEILGELEISLENEKRQDTVRLAHKLKGTAGAAGAQRLFLAALDLELAARDGSGDFHQLQSSLKEAFDLFSSHPAVRDLSSLDAGGEASLG